MRHVTKLMGICALVIATPALAQTNGELIAASQAGASPLYFTVTDATPLVPPGNFSAAWECVPRGGLPAFFAKAQAGKPLKVGFLGGSITQGNAGYRPQVMRYLQSMFPQNAITALNAGVSGTGTDLGACRVEEQLLRHRPDLVFVEFAVNGAYAPGMEGIVRQARSAGAEVCLLYTITGAQTALYAAGGVPDNIRGLEAVAGHYGLPSVHMGMEAARLEQAGKLVWKGDAKDTAGHILFSTDGIHPLQAGGNLYAASVARALEKLRRLPVPSTPAVFPSPLFTDNWAGAGMYAPRDIATFSEGWERISLPQFAAWFGNIEKAATPGAAFSFRFRGTAFGIFDVGGPEAGQITIEVDGKPMQAEPPLVPGTQVYRLRAGDSLPVNRFNSYCNNRYRGQHQIFTLPEGEHRVTIRLSPRKADKKAILGPQQWEDINRHAEKYDRTVLYLGRILLKGAPLPW